MKRFFLVVMILASAASLYAAELKVTGDLYVRGILDGGKEKGKDATRNYFFDYDLTLNAALVANENATVFTRFAFDRTGLDNGTVPMSTGGTDDYTLSIERAYINYKFFPFLQLNTGLMGGGQWASTFADNQSNVVRVQGIGALSEDMIFILIYEKNKEVSKQEKGDETTYYAAAKLKFGAISVLPLFIYKQKGANYDNALTDAFVAAGPPASALAPLMKKYDFKAYAFDLGVEGDFGMVGFTFEGQIKYVDSDGIYDVLPAAYAAFKPTYEDKLAMAGISDGISYGAYVDVFAKLDPAKVGIAAVYESSDAKAGNFADGKDFDFAVVADDLKWGANNGIAGMTMFKVYGEAKAIEKLTVGAAFVYGMPTNDKVVKYDGAGTAAVKATGKDITFWEVDANASWAFDANASYTVAGGYASMKDNDAKATTTNYRVYHQFSVKF